MDKLEMENTNQEARIDQLEEEKTELIINTLEKIPECPVIIHLYFPFRQTDSVNVSFLRFVSTSSRKIVPSTAAPLVITSVEPARPRRSR